MQTQAAEADDDATFEDIEYAVGAAVGHYLSRRAPGDARDMRQEAWEIALAALRSFDPAYGNLRGYVYVAVKRSLGSRISRWLSVTSIHGDALAGRTQQTRVPVKEEHRVTRHTPEAYLLERERLGERLRWGVRFRQALLRALRSFEPWELEVVDRLFGLDGNDGGRQPAEVAEAMGVDVREVYRVAGRVKSELSSSIALYGLGRALRAIEEELP